MSYHNGTGCFQATANVAEWKMLELLEILLFIFSYLSLLEMHKIWTDPPNDKAHKSFLQNLSMKNNRKRYKDNSDEKTFEWNWKKYLPKECYAGLFEFVLIRKKEIPTMLDLWVT